MTPSSRVAALRSTALATSLTLAVALSVSAGDAWAKPDVPLPQIPTAFVYLGCWFLMAGAVYYFLGIETRGKSIEQIDKELTAAADLVTATVRRA